MPITLASSFASLESQTMDWDEADAPGSVKINSIDYACAVDRGAVHGVPSEGGWTSVQDLVVYVRKTLLATPPKSQSAVIDNADGMTFQLQSVGGEQAGSITWVLRCRRIV